MFYICKWMFVTSVLWSVVIVKKELSRWENYFFHSLLSSIFLSFFLSFHFFFLSFYLEVGPLNTGRRRRRKRESCKIPNIRSVTRRSHCENQVWFSFALKSDIRWHQLYQFFWSQVGEIYVQTNNRRWRKCNRLTQQWTAGCGAVVRYAVKVHTGSRKGAGTDADVFLNVFGSQGDTGERFLTHSATNTNKFEKGNVRTV